MPRGATLVRPALVDKENPSVKHERGVTRASLTLQVQGCSMRLWRQPDTQLPDNGGVSGGVYSVALSIPNSPAHSPPALLPGSHLSPAL
ncbi:MAG: hypothetical protein Kow0047_23490 [Anaerolineae bacterium]